MKLFIITVFIFVSAVNTTIDDNILEPINSTPFNKNYYISMLASYNCNTAFDLCESSGLQLSADEKQSGPNEQIPLIFAKYPDQDILIQGEGFIDVTFTKCVLLFTGDGTFKNVSSTEGSYRFMCSAKKEKIAQQDVEKIEIKPARSGNIEEVQ